MMKTTTKKNLKNKKKFDQYKFYGVARLVKTPKKTTQKELRNNIENQQKC